MRQLLCGPEGLRHYSSAPAIYTAGERVEEEDAEEDVQTGAIQHLGEGGGVEDEGEEVHTQQIPFLRMKRREIRTSISFFLSFFFSFCAFIFRILQRLSVGKHFLTLI